jgi:hypothetical protein
MGEERSALNVAIADELEGPVLGVDGRFIVERAVFEMKDQTQGQTLPMHGLRDISLREQTSVHCADGEKSVQRSLQMADRDRLRRCAGRDQAEQRGGNRETSQAVCKRRVNSGLPMRPKDAKPDSWMRNGAPAALKIANVYP